MKVIYILNVLFCNEHVSKQEWPTMNSGVARGGSKFTLWASS